MAIEIVDLPIKNCDFHSYVNVYKRVDMIRWGFESGADFFE